MLFIRGASSDTFLPGAAARVERELGGATVLEVEDTSHFAPMERPAEVASAIANWTQLLEADD